MKFQTTNFQTNLRCIILTLSVCLFLSENNKCISNNYLFRNIDVNDGLSQNAVFSILKDSKGFMWFGTKDGLNKYDGYSFTVFQNDPFDSTTISASYVLSLFEDSRGYLWIGTYDGGINVFDRKTELFHRITLSANELTSGNIFEIQSITEDKKGNIWVASNGNGLFKLQIEEEDFSNVKRTQYLHNENIRSSLSSNYVLDVHVDKNGALWIGTQNGLNHYNENNDNFSYFEINTKNPSAPEIEQYLSISSVHESSDNNLWLGTIGGLVKFDRSNASFQYYPHKYD